METLLNEDYRSSPVRDYVDRCIGFLRFLWSEAAAQWSRLEEVTTSFPENRSRLREVTRIFLVPLGGFGRPLGALWEAFWRPLGGLWDAFGSFWDSKKRQEVPKRRPRGPKRPSKSLKKLPRERQEAPKSCPRALFSTHRGKFLLQKTIKK